MGVENKLPFITITAIENGYIVRPEWIQKEGVNSGQWVFNDFGELTDWLWENMPQHGLKGSRID